MQKKYENRESFWLIDVKQMFEVKYRFVRNVAAQAATLFLTNLEHRGGELHQTPQLKQKEEKR